MTVYTTFTAEKRGCTCNSGLHSIAKRDFNFTFCIKLPLAAWLHLRKFTKCPLSRGLGWSLTLHVCNKYTLRYVHVTSVGMNSLRIEGEGAESGQACAFNLVLTSWNQGRDG